MSDKSPASPQTFRLKGVSCAGCVKKIESALGDVPGVDDARVNLGDKTLVVQGSAAAQDCIAAVESAGYGRKRCGQVRANCASNSARMSRTITGNCCGARVLRWGWAYR
ncbi:cation transporter [Microbulbifer sp. ALW1]|uniref:cation transporter n=1 Tax=Microbulbifer sp. (strain ALW1) TaxID=1516059 RepID=UPI001F3508D5|nr:cation transporter [Microbulbifer sp. ALW1]